MIGATRGLSMSAWQSGSRSRSSLPFHRARGSAVATRTPTGCCASPCPRGPTCRGTRSVAECHRPSLQHASQKMPQFCHAPGSLYATAPSFTRCTWNLKPPRKRISRTNYKTGDVCDVKSAKICGKAMLFHVSRSRSSVLQLEFVENIVHMVLYR